MAVVAAAIALVWPSTAPTASASGAGVIVAPTVAGAPRSPIEHIVFIAKENRSFDHYFGTFPDPTGSLDQSTSARCYRKGNPTVVDSFTMAKAPDPMAQDVEHSNAAFHTAYHDGRMDGFCHEYGAIVEPTGEDIADTQMRAGDIPNYWAYANKYGIGDRMFASWRGASFANNVFAVAAQSGRYSTKLGRRAIFGNPFGGDAGVHSWGCDNSADTMVTMIDLAGKKSPTFPCFGFKTMPGLMDDAGVSWRYYGVKSHFIHSGIAAIDSIRCAPGDTAPCTDPNPYWDQHVKQDTQIFADVANGTLPAVSWYLPDATEHPPKTACGGENSTVRAVNAIMQSPDWKSTAIVVWWDEWGGFYDHAKPPTAEGVDDGVTGLNKLISYGFRVPLIVISPWVKRGPLGNGGYANRTFYSHASFARFVEWAFNLPTMDAADDLSNYTAREPKPGKLTEFFDFSSATPPKGKLTLSSRVCPRLSAAQEEYIRTSDDD
jgi:phospholipase C